MATELEIVNQALLLLGEGPLTSGQLATPDDATSRTVAGFLPLSRKAVLRGCYPSCARAYAALVETPAVQPAHPDHLYLYDLPADSLRILRVISSNSAEIVANVGAPIISRWRILTGRKLAADEQTLAVEYVKNIATTDFDGLTDEALAAHLAWKLALPLTESTTKQAAMAKLYEVNKALVLGTDQLEGNIDRFSDATRLTSFRHGSL